MNYFEPRIFGVRVRYVEYQFYRKVWERHLAGLPRKVKLEFPDYPVLPFPGINGVMIRRFLNEARTIWEIDEPEERENAVLIGHSPPSSQPQMQLTLDAMREVLDEILYIQPVKKLETGAETQSTPRGNFEKTGKTLNADEDLDALFAEIDAIT